MDVLQGCWVLRGSVSNGMMEVANLLRPSLRSYVMSFPLHWVSQKRLHGEPSLKRRENWLPLSVAAKSQKFVPSLKYHTKLAMSKVWLYWLIECRMGVFQPSFKIWVRSAQLCRCWACDRSQHQLKMISAVKNRQPKSNLIILCKNVFA